MFLKYLFFSALSISINLGTQEIFFSLFKNLFFSMAIGTAFGLGSKYLFDKILVFKDKSNSKSEEAKKAFIYTFFGGLMTLLFWGVEGSFVYFLGLEYRTIGGLVGLCLGYSIKFFLDQKFVFKKP